MYGYSPPDYTLITAGYYRLIGFVVILVLSWICLFHRNNERISRWWWSMKNLLVFQLTLWNELVGNDKTFVLISSSSPSKYLRNHPLWTHLFALLKRLVVANEIDYSSHSSINIISWLNIGQKKRKRRRSTLNSTNKRASERTYERERDSFILIYTLHNIMHL